MTNDNDLIRRGDALEICTDYGFSRADECRRAIAAIPAAPAPTLAAALALPEIAALVEAARRASHATTNDGITGRIYTDEAIALQVALAATKVTP